MAASRADRSSGVGMEQKTSGETTVSQAAAGNGNVAADASARA